MNRTIQIVGSSVALAVACAASAQNITGPSSSATPYVLPTPGSKVTKVVSLLTVGDSVNNDAAGNPYRLIGIPDGMGAYSNGDGTFTLLVAHELGATTGGGRRAAHQPKGFANGAFNSQWTIRSSDFTVLEGSDMMQSVATTTNGSGGSLYNFARFCSADLGAMSAFYNAATGLGVQEQFFLQGEESGSNGRVIATGTSERVGYQLPAFDPMGGTWETVVARPFASDKTVCVGCSDGSGNRVSVYVGDKQSTGSSIEKAGLMNGVARGINVIVNGAVVAGESRDFCFGTDSVILSADFTLGQPGVEEGTSFLRPEDGAWDPANPSDFYFVCTDRVDNTADGGTAIGRSRLFRLRFSDVNDVFAGGTIEAVLDGTEAMQMGDNLCVYNDLQGGARVILQEDPGSAAFSARTWLYTAATDVLEPLLLSDPARFGDTGIPATAPFNTNEENSGVIDARAELGLGWFLANMQAHYGIAGELVEGGQLYAFYCPECVGSCAGDLNGDGTVGADDLSVVLGNWGNATGDLNGDGTTDGADLAALLSGWGSCN